LPLPSGAATETTLTALLTTTAFQARINTLGQKTMANSTPIVIASDQSALPVSAASLPLPTGAATETTLAAHLTQSDFDTKVGSLTETAPATDTASSGLNGRLQRIAQNITTLIGSALTMVGNVAAAASDSGNPVKTGGKYNSTKPTYTNGQRGDTQIEINGATAVSVYGKSTNAGDTPILLDSSGQQRVSIYTTAGNGVSNGQLTTDGISNPFVYDIFALGAAFNGASWDRVRSVGALILLASAARTVTTNSADQINYNWRGAHIIVDISSAGTGSITPSLQVKDSISGNYKTIWTAAAALTGNGTYVYEVYPASLGSASFTEVVQAIIGGRTWRLAMVHNNANTITYSASADMIL